MPSKGRLIVLIALLGALAALVVYEWPLIAGTNAGREAAATSGASGATGRSSQAVVPAVPAVRLDALAAAQAAPTPPQGERNPFLFHAKLPPPPPPMAGGRGGAPGANGRGVAAVPVPVTPPPPPPIPLKFIGIVQRSGQKLAILSDDATKDVFSGREGDVIDGRYRILRIGVESIELAYVDGRGRQTIRLTGA